MIGPADHPWRSYALVLARKTGMDVRRTFAGCSAFGDVFGDDMSRVRCLPMETGEPHGPYLDRTARFRVIDARTPRQHAEAAARANRWAWDARNGS